MCGKIVSLSNAPKGENVTASARIPFGLKLS